MGSYHSEHSIQVTVPGFGVPSLLCLPIPHMYLLPHGAVRHFDKSVR